MAALEHRTDRKATRTPVRVPATAPPITAIKFSGMAGLGVFLPFLILMIDFDFCYAHEGTEGAPFILFLRYKLRMPRSSFYVGLGYNVRLC